MLAIARRSLCADVKALGVGPIMGKRWASKKGGGSSKNGRSTAGKRLGLKKSGG